MWRCCNGWSRVVVIWGLAVLGIVLDSLPQKGQRILPVVIHLIMGWLALAAFKRLLLAWPRSGFFLLLAGGLFYTLVVIFYALEDRMRHSHGVWHLFMLAGNLCHYFTVLIYVL